MVIGGGGSYQTVVVGVVCRLCWNSGTWLSLGSAEPERGQPGSSKTGSISSAYWPSVSEGRRHWCVHLGLNGPDDWATDEGLSECLVHN